MTEDDAGLLAPKPRVWAAGPAERTPLAVAVWPANLDAAARCAQCLATGAAAPMLQCASAVARHGFVSAGRRYASGELHMAKKPSAKQRRKRIEELLRPFRVTKGKGFHLSEMDPTDTRGVRSKQEAQEHLQEGIKLLAAMQDKLYAQDQWGVLLVFQAMDAAGKDGAIKHVMSGVNPQGCQVYSFKSPTSEELDHDFLWRTSKSLPERGRIGIFNRSYYEEVLVVRVHPEILEKQKLPGRLVTKRIWDERYEDIRSFERYLARQGYVVLKFFLNVSKKAQRERFLERLDLPQKNWKFSLADAKERGHWDEYQRAYEQMIGATATRHAPWYVVPADHKWFSRLLVAAAVHDALDRLDLAYPKVDEAKRKDLAAARAALGGPAKGSPRKAAREEPRPDADRPDKGRPDEARPREGADQ
jgi:PPK2 family polyphosphate:nucleotide phosphotransferase